MENSRNLVSEINPLTSDEKRDREERPITRTQKVWWTEEGLRITRLRFLTDPGYPFLDVSYCEGEINGERVNVALPFSELYRKGWKTELYKYAREEGTFIKGLFDSVSILY